MADRKPTTVRRAELADAALALVATRGIAALSTRALAEAVGLTTGALFRHYPSLDDLLVGVCERAAELVDASYPDRALPGPARLVGFAQARLRLVREHPGVPQLVLSEQFALALPEAAREHLRRAVADTHAFLAEAVSDGQRSGEFRRDVDAAAIATLIMGAMQMAVVRAGRGEIADPAPLAALRVLLHHPHPENPS